MIILRSLLFWVAFLVLIPQALWVRRTARRFPPADGPRSGQHGQGGSLRLLAIGDSIIDGVGVSHLDNALVGQVVAGLSEAVSATIHWQALGRSGFNSTQVRRHLLPQAAPEPADLVLVSVGVNDIIGLRNLAHWRREVDELIKAIIKHSPNARIAMAAIPPMERFPALPQPLRSILGMRGRDFQVVLEAVAAGFENVDVVTPEFDRNLENFSADGFHPSQRGYRICARAVSAILSERNGPGVDTEFSQSGYDRTHELQKKQVDT